MSSAVLVFAALALLCAALALLLWQRSAQRKGQVSAERYIDSRVASSGGGAFGVASAMPAGAGVVGGGAGSVGSGPASGARATPARAATTHAVIAPQAPPADAGWLAYWRYLQARARFMVRHALARAGIANAKGPAALAGTLVLLLCGWAALVGGALAAGVALCACVMFFYFLLTLRVNKRRQQIVRQLPLFLDGIVRLITLGNSVPAAFQAALQTTEAPLRECLDYVSRMLRTGVEIDRALSQVALIYGVRELELVGAVLRLSVKYGGRADVMLERMASFMRDLEHAERELVAMSAETRLSSWVLAMLPVGIGGFLILSNPKYFASMWFDPTGRQLVYLAFALQLGGAYLLYRLANLRN
ncbi:type II secretion system (T2SS), F family protein [Paraburkholderia xenovorans LB400]|uniref:Tight adherence TadB related transmembrane protein n=1 Tax=Paraburkholderia xenovorans (strain LB400) TaxID=266265 RepID=Q140S1_PARXL|nr:type II secretion system F family protein [Paraburkholderia xenovorans]ABE30168.1 Putative tight adherence TadB related transmembrane protein [Paraburkholderia xenovorans LB400]AIP31165.1 type II secretion system (T2SS), F family protein [Paraburkholderia xenovorans LB400]